MQAATNPLARSIVSPNLGNNSNASMALLCERYINVCIARDRRPSIHKGVGFWGIQSVFAEGLHPVTTYAYPTTLKKKKKEDNNI